MSQTPTLEAFGHRTMTQLGKRRKRSDAGNMHLNGFVNLNQWESLDANRHNFGGF